MKKIVLGNTGLEVTPLCIGTAALGNMPDDFGLNVTDEMAADTIRAIFNSSFNFLDTAAIYGESEKRIGNALRLRGGLPSGFVLATKADRNPVTGDFSGDQVRKSIALSLERLGLPKLQIVYLHDPEHSTCSFEQIMSPEGAVEALGQLQKEGVIEHIGISAGPPELLKRFLDSTDVFELMITHNRYNLIDQTADTLISYACEKGVSVINAAPFAGGIFARGSVEYPRVAYEQASEVILKKVKRIESLCQEMSVSPRAAALHFSLRDTRIASTIAGVVSPEQVEQLQVDSAVTIPDHFWNRLSDLSSALE